MCGITGIMAHNEIGRFFMVRAHAANEAIKHRGPDAGKLFNNNYVVLGHRRLAILDLSVNGVQPMWDESERYGIVFNGEIFNYLELKEDLVKQGLSFKSDTDTEVLLNLFIREGESCLQKLNGFFAFCIYDSEKETFFIARDRMGIKPFLYYADDDKFIFASEMKSLLAYNMPVEIDFNAVYTYFQLHYIPAPHTIFKNIHKLPQGHCMWVRGKEIEIKSYYEPQYLPEPPITDYEGAQKQLVSLLEDSVRRRLISDVPLGAFLSGGIDSSAIVALAVRHTKHLNTFSIGYKDEPFFDETNYANLVAKKFNTHHTVFALSNDEIFAAIFEMIHYLGEPFADSSAIPFYVLSKHTRQKATVALSGDGGDELFAGYNKHMGEYMVRNGGMKAQLVKAMMPFLSKMPQSRNSFLGNKVRQLYRFGEASEMLASDRYWYLSCFMSEDKIQHLFSEKAFSNINLTENEKRKNIFIQDIKGIDINEMLYADVKMLLPNDMLHKADSMSMANALEVRVPFLDYRVVNFAFNLPVKFKIDHKMKKKIVQDAFKDILPRELYNRPKHGFDVPLMKGYKTVLRSWIEEMLDAQFIEEQGIFNPAYIRELKNTIFNTENYDQNHVWAILVFQHWWKNIFTPTQV